MDVSIRQDCTAYHTDGLGNDICASSEYIGRLDNVQISIPTLEAMGLIFLWLTIAIATVSLFKRFS